MNVPKIKKEIRLDNVRADIETRILVFETAPETGPCAYFAQVYRRRGGTGEWSEFLHTTQIMPSDLHAETAARMWNRAHPLVLEPVAVPA